TAEEMNAIVRNNPFPQTGGDERLLHVFFLADLPDARNLQKLDPSRSPPDSFHVHNREIYVHFPNGAGRSKLTTDYLEARLGTVSTARNWRSVLTLTKMLADRNR